MLLIQLQHDWIVSANTNLKIVFKTIHSGTAEMEQLNPVQFTSSNVLYSLMK